MPPAFLIPIYLSLRVQRQYLNVTSSRVCRKIATEVGASSVIGKLYRPRQTMTHVGDRFPPRVALRQENGVMHFAFSTRTWCSLYGQMHILTNKVFRSHQHETSHIRVRGVRVLFCGDVTMPHCMYFQILYHVSLVYLGHVRGLVMKQVTKFLHRLSFLNGRRQPYPAA